MTVISSEISCSPNAIAICIVESSLQKSERTVLRFIREKIHSTSNSKRTKKVKNHRLKLALKATPKGPLTIKGTMMMKIGIARTSIRRLSDRNASMKSLSNILRLKRRK
jgi:hypothetical protein